MVWIQGLGHYILEKTNDVMSNKTTSFSLFDSDESYYIPGHTAK